MNNIDSTQTPRPDYSGGHIFFSRLFFLIEAGLALFLIFSDRMEFGILYLIYALICVFLLMPLFRCAHCDYYGRRCSYGWGKLASKMVRDEYRGLFKNQAGLNIIFWPLRLVPILLSLSGILGSIVTETFDFRNYYIFGFYLLILILQMIIFKSRVCPAPIDSGGSPITDARHG
jgi:hypothetical protein